MATAGDVRDAARHESARRTGRGRCLLSGTTGMILRPRRPGTGMSSSVSSRGCANGRLGGSVGAGSASGVAGCWPAGSRMASRPNTPRNSASKSRRTPVSGSSHPPGGARIRTPGEEAEALVVRPHTGEPSNVRASKTRWTAPGRAGSGADDAERRRAGGIVVEVRPRGDAEGGRDAGIVVKATRHPGDAPPGGAGGGEASVAVARARVKCCCSRGRTPGRGVGRDARPRGGARRAGGKGASAVLSRTWRASSDPARRGEDGGEEEALRDVETGHISGS